jgi:hypothetical protein
MVDFEHRSGAYMKYVSTGVQKYAICRQSSRVSKRALRPTNADRQESAASPTLFGTISGSPLYYPIG